MARSVLMQVLIDCENQLGWIPKGKNHQRALSNHHRVMTQVLATRRVSEEDLALAVAFCRSRRHPISDPLQLLGFVDRAKERTLIPQRRLSKSLDERQADALAWEAACSDQDSPVWTNRLIRSVAAGLAETLTEWHQAGRGPLQEAA